MIPVAGFLIGYGAVALVKSGKLDGYLFGLRLRSQQRRNARAKGLTESWLSFLESLPVEGGES